MKPRTVLPVFVFAVCLGLATAQDAPAPQNQGPRTGQRWQGGGGGRFMTGRGNLGTVTEAASDHFTIKTELGETYTVHYSVNTRIMKQPPGPPRRNREAGEGEGAEERGMERSANPPQPIKATEIKVGDVIAANGEVDQNAKSIGAVFIMLMDPERVKEMRAMEANFGKTWLAGRVTAIQEVKVTLQGGPKNETHFFVADENTTFRKRRDPITLADIQVGEMVRAEGAVKDGNFIATSVVDMGTPPAGGPGGPQQGGIPAGLPQGPPQ
jgi:hypothetical protein